MTDATAVIGGLTVGSACRVCRERMVAQKQGATLDMRTITWMSELESARELDREVFFRHYHTKVRRAMMQPLEGRTEGNDDTSLRLYPKKERKKVVTRGTRHSSPNGLWWYGVRSPCQHIPSSRGGTTHGDSDALGIPCVWVGALGIRNAHQRLVGIVIPTVTHIDCLLGIGGVGESRNGESRDRPSRGVSRERSGVGEPNDGG